MTSNLADTMDDSLPRRCVLLWVCLALAICGCGPGGDPPTDDGGDENSAMQDAGNDSSAPGDMTSGTEDVGPTGEFQIGTNPVGENTPEGFTRMTEGARVPIVWGVQGSWMVVLAFRSQDLFADKFFDVRADITIDGVERGDIWLEGQETFPGGDGWNYYYSLFLALDIDGDPPPPGTPAHISMTVEAEDGTIAEQEHDVEIGESIGGPNE